ncbi:hypothetical protein [Snodgrassella alvi]
MTVGIPDLWRSHDSAEARCEWVAPLKVVRGAVSGAVSCKS